MALASVACLLISSILTFALNVLRPAPLVQIILSALAVPLVSISVVTPAFPVRIISLPL